ncbi:uncharacterized protein LOC121743668 [Salvia splendens]|uniref:uncharacterized protein LOC121743668 n=1 Tax=Salvia splendens TaxID=180675 RepID=UPI001C26E1B2|nr:uncharacterized protein LOC121743668 [Salvia splendens]
MPTHGVHLSLSHSSSPTTLSPSPLYFSRRGHPKVTEIKAPSPVPNRPVTAAVVFAPSRSAYPFLSPEAAPFNPAVCGMKSDWVEKSIPLIGRFLKKRKQLDEFLGFYFNCQFLLNCDFKNWYHGIKIWRSLRRNILSRRRIIFIESQIKFDLVTKSTGREFDLV